MPGRLFGRLVRSRRRRESETPRRQVLGDVPTACSNCADKEIDHALPWSVVDPSRATMTD